MQISLFLCFKNISAHSASPHHRLVDDRLTITTQSTYLAKECLYWFNHFLAPNKPPQKLVPSCLVSAAWKPPVRVAYPCVFGSY